MDLGSPKFFPKTRQKKFGMGGKTTFYIKTKQKLQKKKITGKTQTQAENTSKNFVLLDKKSTQR